jgi:DNA-binding GntR family transcriptional regulator
MVNKLMPTIIPQVTGIPQNTGPVWIAPATLSGKAYVSLLSMIQERRLPSGAPVVEQQLAGLIGVSRTPLRHALQRLEVEGLLKKDANKSYIVRKVELKEYLQSLRVRELLEGEAAALSVGRVALEAIETTRANLHIVQAQEPYDMISHWRSDAEVHGLFILNCGNETMTAMLQSLRVTTNLFEVDKLAQRLKPDTKQHERILDALKERDAKAARRAVVAHIRSLLQFALRSAV